MDEVHQMNKMNSINGQERHLRRRATVVLGCIIAATTTACIIFVISSSAGRRVGDNNDIAISNSNNHHQQSSIRRETLRKRRGDAWPAAAALAQQQRRPAPQPTPSYQQYRRVQNNRPNKRPNKKPNKRPSKNNGSEEEEMSTTGTEKEEEVGTSSSLADTLNDYYSSVKTADETSTSTAASATTTTATSNEVGIDSGIVGSTEPIPIIVTDPVDQFIDDDASLTTTTSATTEHPPIHTDQIDQFEVASMPTTVTTVATTTTAANDDPTTENDNDVALLYWYPESSSDDGKPHCTSTTNYMPHGFESEEECCVAYNVCDDASSTSATSTATATSTSTATSATVAEITKKYWYPMYASTGLYCTFSTTYLANTFDNEVDCCTAYGIDCSGGSDEETVDGDGDEGVDDLMESTSSTAVAIIEEAQDSVSSTTTATSNSILTTETTSAETTTESTTTSAGATTASTTITTSETPLTYEYWYPELSSTSNMPECISKVTNVEESSSSSFFNSREECCIAFPVACSTTTHEDDDDATTTIYWYPNIHNAEESNNSEGIVRCTQGNEYPTEWTGKLDEYLFRNIGDCCTKWRCGSDISTIQSIAITSSINNNKWHESITQYKTCTNSHDYPSEWDNIPHIHASGNVFFTSAEECCAKHFPGEGECTVVDVTESSQIVQQDADELKFTDIELKGYTIWCVEGSTQDDQENEEPLYYPSCGTVGFPICEPSSSTNPTTTNCGTAECSCSEGLKSCSGDTTHKCSQSSLLVETTATHNEEVVTPSMTGCDLSSRGTSRGSDVGSDGEYKHYFQFDCVGSQVEDFEDDIFNLPFEFNNHSSSTATSDTDGDDVALWERTDSQAYSGTYSLTNIINTTSAQLTGANPTNLTLHVNLPKAATISCMIKLHTSMPYDYFALYINDNQRNVYHTKVDTWVEVVTGMGRGDNAIVFSVNNPMMEETTSNIGMRDFDGLGSGKVYLDDCRIVERN